MQAEPNKSINKPIHKIAVFCGANTKPSDEYKNGAYAVGQALAVHGFALVTGGANLGMMKSVVDGHMAINPNLDRLGVMPRLFEKYEVQHQDLRADQMIWVDTVNERLQKFYELSDAIVVLPGGYGTLHELMDSLIQNQFGFMLKRIYLFNLFNFWDAIIQQLQHMVVIKTLEQKHLDHLIVVNSCDELIADLSSTTERKLSQGFEEKHWY